MRPFFAVVLTLLFLGGCTVGKTVMPVATNVFPTPQAALMAIIPAADTNTLYRMTAKVSVSSPQRKFNFRLAVIMQSPDKLRLESIPVLGPPDFILTAQGGKFQVYLPGTQEFITGKTTPDNLAGFLPLPWSTERWMAMLRGNNPDVFPDSARLRGKMEELLYRVDALSGGSVMESLWINPEHKRLEKMERLLSQNSKETISCSSFRKINGRDFPAYIRIDAGEGKTIGITYETIETSHEIPDDLFMLLPPTDAAMTSLPD